jgi:3-keto-L-gulonate-6-phosphate decarboxylase
VVVWFNPPAPVTVAVQGGLIEEPVQVTLAGQVTTVVVGALVIWKGADPKLAAYSEVSEKV